MRFYKDKLYHFKGRGYLGISGFRSMHDYEQIILGRFVGTRAYDKSHCLGEFHGDERTYEIEDGHLPGYRIKARGDELAACMTRHQWPTATPIAA